ncbi:MAG: phenylalanine--tRNA ligase subunit alpha, partial [Candidatus Daviesbacteria bacterium]|nr:phenylalanine--tRNA ligase subunit alpha [Candidatus Daviesbacteria bacterium]
MEERINNIQQEYLDKINSAKSLADLDKIFLALFGKKGQLDLLSKELPQLSENERRKTGPLFNKVKQQLEKAIEEKRQVIREESYKNLVNEKINLTDTKVIDRTGHLHPITKLEKEIVDLFKNLGFTLFEAPHVDTDLYNFELLNIPKDHPARDLWDTLYINTSNLKNVSPGGLLLRTHTSNGQIRAMKNLKPPIRIIIMDRCFRYENLDARHEHTFEQFELVYIDKKVNMANLQYLSEYFF